MANSSAIAQELQRLLQRLLSHEVVVHLGLDQLTLHPDDATTEVGPEVVEGQDMVDDGEVSRGLSGDGLADRMRRGL